MSKFKNVSSLGELDVPALNAIVGAGAVVDVDGDLAAAFADQPSIWQALDDDGKPLPVEKVKAEKPEAVEENGVVDPERVIYTAPEPIVVKSTPTTKPKTAESDPQEASK